MRFALLLLCLMFEMAQPGAADEPFQLGIILPLSGSNSAFGTGVRNGCLLAHEKLPAAFKRGLALNFEDDSYSPAKALSGAHALIQKGLADGLITLSSGPSAVVAPLAQQKKIPQLAIATNDGFTAGKNFVKSIWTDPELEAQVISDEALRRGYKRIARISVENPVIIEVLKWFDRQVAGNIDIVFDEWVSPEDSDIKPSLLRLKDKGPVDAIMLNLLPNALGQAAKNARQLGLSGEFFDVEVICGSPDALELAGGALDGAWCGTAVQPAESFLNEFRARFPQSSELGAANCYDAVNLFAAALQSGAKNPIQVAAWLSNVENYQGALGRISSKGRDTFSVGAEVQEVKGGKVQTIKKLETR